MRRYGCSQARSLAVEMASVCLGLIGVCVCVCFMLSPDFDLRDGDDDSQVWGRRPSNLETELQQMQDVSQLYHNPSHD